ncbi:MAG TPA: hypothetical protein VMZ90_12030 [Vicinamibacterales bacterium]|nr:hypothetical protein [Vicinamibacterales bacterium]
MELDRHNDHPDEEALVLLFYGDTGLDEERQMTAHLDSCVTCQPVWQQIRTTLAAVDVAAVPEPPSDFERVMWARVQGALETMNVTPTPWWSLRHLLPAGALAAALLAMFAVGRYWPGQGAQAGAPTDPAATSAAAAASQSERALLVAMDDHLQRSELLLVELMNAPANDAVLQGFERETASDLLSSGRLYRQTATHTGNVHLAAMLEDLEAVLVEIARSPRALKAQDVNALRTRIEEDDLLFKVRVVSGEIRERQKTISTVSEGDR